MVRRGFPWENRSLPEFYSGVQTGEPVCFTRPAVERLLRRVFVFYDHSSIVENMVLSSLIAKNREAILKLASRHGASNVRIFGSVARGEAEAGSDVDFLVTLGSGRDLFDLGALLMDLQDLLHRQVDVVTEQALHRRIRSRVMKEAVSL